MAGSSKFTFLSLNSLNSLKTFRKNSIDIGRRFFETYTKLVVLKETFTARYAKAGIVFRGNR